jgi:glycerophosphoryl diester phosphodiesterase
MEDVFPAGRVVAIAHRGGAALRPENTLAAFDHAATLGVHGFECDVHLSRDGVPMVIHDATLDRTTNATGPVGAQDAKALAALDAGYHFQNGDGFPYRGAGIAVPRLADLLDRHPDMPVIIEVKGDRAEVVPPILRVIRGTRRPARVFIGGFSHTVLTAFRTLAPDIPTGASRQDVEATARRVAQGLAPERTGYALFQIPYFFRGEQVLTEPLARAIVHASIQLQSWVIDTEADMKLMIAWGVTGLISDRPDRVVLLIGKGTGLTKRSR